MRKREGFTNQILILIPRNIIQKSTDLTKEFYMTDIGYYPRAEEHYVSRRKGEPAYIFILCTDGAGWCKVAGTHYEIKKNEAIIIDRETPHTYGSVGKGWWQLFWIHFNGSKAKDFAEKLTGDTVNRKFTLKTSIESKQLFSLICSSLREEINLMNFELACFRLWHLAGSLIRDRKTGSLDYYGHIQKCLKYIEKSLDTTLTLKELSNESGLTPQYLCRLFKRTIGHSPMEYHMMKKIQRACTLLDMTDLRINEISSQIGLKDPYYFTRVFKRVMKMSPTEYRHRQS